MGRLCRHSSTIYMDSYDVDGVCTVLSRRIDWNDAKVDANSALVGAFHMLDMLRLHEFRDQEEFFGVFDACAPWREVPNEQD